MDIQKLRVPTFTATEYLVARAGTQTRVKLPVSVTEAKPQPAPPVGKGGELWNSFYAEALLRNDPDPEKMADSILRARERSIAITAARHKTKLTLVPPKPSETVAANKGPKKAKGVAHEAFRCKALTLEGRRCGFKSTCGDFCKKHSVEKM
jgi:hypothetical protein